ncbi:IclR family transcriptional regulator [Brachybacterium sp. DNPG3]
MTPSAELPATSSAASSVASSAASSATSSADVPASPVGSVDKALLLLEALADVGPDGAPLGVLAATTGFSKASVHRLLGALAHRDFAAQNPSDQHYRIGSAAMALSRSTAREENLPVLFAPALASISRRVDELVHLGRLDGAHVLYLDKVEPERTLRVWSEVGKRTPAGRTALGRAMLAADGVRGPALAPYADATAAPGGATLDADALAQVIDETAARGWSMECEENEPGIACVGVALVRPDGRSAAVSVTGPVERMGPERRAEVAALLREELERLAPAGFAVA